MFSFNSNYINHNQYDDRWNYRRRYQRRHQYLTSSIPEEQEREVDEVSYENNINEETNGTILLSAPIDDNSSSSSCPFSKTFPKFRIDLTTTTKNNKNRKKQQQRRQQQQWDFLPPIVVSNAVAVIEAANALELPTLYIPWKRSRQLNQLERKYVDDDLMFIVKPDIDGITAFAFLWKAAARLMGLLNNNNEGDDSASSYDAIVVLPDSSMELVQNFCEIVNWMTTTMMTEVILLAQLVKEEGVEEIPTVRLEMRLRPQPQRRNEIVSNNIINDDDNEQIIINERTRQWVKRVLVEQGICPFTQSDRMSGQGLADLGVKVGSIAYHASFRTHPIGLFADTWDAIDEMIKAGPEGRKGVSSILLAAPAFDDDFDVWSGPIFAMLEAGVLAAGAESEVGVVCFHPRYATPDGSSWPGFGQMHSVPRLEKWYRESSTSSSSSSSATDIELTTEQIAAGGAWQRRTPHATINVLRADQLEVAETRRKSGNLYTENINKLVGIDGIGNKKLAEDLERERQLCVVKKKK
jgi:hypothetical protein